MEESKYLEKRMDYRRNQARAKYFEDLERNCSKVVALAKMAVSDAMSFLSGAGGIRGIRGLEPRPSQGVVTLAPSRQSIVDRLICETKRKLYLAPRPYSGILIFCCAPALFQN